MSMDDLGRSPDGSGSRPADRAASAGVSPVPASIPSASLRMERYDSISARIVCDDAVIGMLLEHADGLWSINNSQARPICKIRFLTRKKAFDFACARDLFASAIEARRAETGNTGSVHESAVRDSGDAHEGS